MTSFDSSPQLNVWRASLALAVVFVMLATTGWTAIRSHRGQSPLQASLSAWQRGHLDGNALPDADSSPRQLAAFFASLDDAQLDRLAHRYPLAVGNMNGAPVELRYLANRVALKKQSARERARMHDKRLTEAGQYEAGRRMHRFADLAAKKRQILAFDPEGSGRAAEVFGDLDKAERVSIVVPGVDTDVITFQRTNRKYSAPVGMANSLYRAERATGSKTHTAVIAWADYTAPNGLGLDSATALRAEQGSVRLKALVAALPGDSTVALYCHSYGSVVCGVGARSLPSRVTDIVVAGSPGMRVEKASQLGTTARVWAMRDADDWIQDVPNLELGGLGHGADPVSEEFGARLLSASDAVGHTGYFEPGTVSLYNFAEIGIGAYRSVHCAQEDDRCLAGLPDSATT
ncbi:uncharacterized protein SGFS_080610 [Streptomyces graminofaciens]|uniref:DUF1023 domain-containing protein n=1 Tax=Streptomyces graminofaciens TaxID=68212 RepID=A0ABN5VXV1_9ACTN|nr:alpha/beta hydrolase [Streptomyces graminofaciens]BBC36767.1 uncharacterized protein SGFS_080610 [Streptomyces graminofaciens]